MVEEINEKKEFPQNDPPGNEWVLIRSGRAPYEAKKGDVIPEKWLLGETGHIFVRNKETDEWFIYDKKKEIFSPAQKQWQQWAGEIWTRKPTSLTMKFRDNLIHILQRLGFGKIKPIKADITDDNNQINWDKLYKVINPNQISRKEVFPDGTENMSKSKIYTHIKNNYSFILGGQINPLEFPEVIDEGLRPLCNVINKTAWARSSDCCTGHSYDETNHMNDGYKFPYLRLFLDTNNPQSEKLIEDIEKLSDEWQKKFPNLKIDLHKENRIIDNYNKTRIVNYSINLRIHAPDEAYENEYYNSEECRKISASFFSELGKRITE